MVGLRRPFSADPPTKDGIACTGLWGDVQEDRPLTRQASSKGCNALRASSLPSEIVFSLCRTLLYTWTTTACDAQEIACWCFRGGSSGDRQLH